MYVYFGFCHQQHESGPTLETIGLAADVEAHAVLVSAAVLLVCCCVPGLLLCAVCCAVLCHFLICWGVAVGNAGVCGGTAKKRPESPGKKHVTYPRKAVPVITGYGLSTSL